MLLYGAVLIGPQKVSELVQGELQAIQPRIAPFSITAQSTKVSVARIGGPVIVEMEKVDVARDGHIFIRIPHITTQWGMRIFPTPRIALRYGQIESPHILAESALTDPTEKAPPDAKPKSEETTRQQWQRIKKKIALIHHTLTIHGLSITDGHIHLPANGDGPREALLSAEITYRHKTLNGTLDLKLPKDTMGQPENIIEPKVSLRIQGNPENGSAQFSGTADGLILSHFANLSLPSMMAGAEMPIHADIQGALEREKLKGASATIETGAGNFVWVEQFSAPLPLQKLTAQIEVEENMRAIHLRKVVAAMPDITLHADIDFNQPLEAMSLQGTAGYDHVKTERLALYWPLSLAPMTRTWAIENIREGGMRDADVKLDISPQELETGKLSAKSLNATMTIDGATVHYLPGHPDVTHIQGPLHFTGKAMTLAIESADYMAGSHMSNGSLTIPDFDAPETALQTEFDLKTTAQDVARLFDTKEINLSKRLNLTKDAKGTAEGRVRFSAIIFSSMPSPPPGYYEDMFKYDVHADTQNLGQPNFMKQTDISDANLSIDANNDILAIDGALKLFEVPTKLKLNNDFHTHQTVIDIAMQMPAAKLEAFGYPIKEGISGTLGVTAKMTQTPKDDRTEAKIDLKDAGLKLAMAGIEKPKDIAGTLTLNTRAIESGTEIESFDLQAPQTILRGGARMSKAGELQWLDIKDIQSGRQHASLQYSAGEKGMRVIRAQGESLDLYPWRKQQEEEAKKHPKTESNPLDPGPIDLQANLQKAWLSKETPIYDLAATLHCTEILCDAMDIRGSVPTTNTEKKNLAPFAIRIASPNGTRHFSLSADDGGRLLDAADVSEHIRGGKSQIEGDYKDNEPGHPLTGKVKVRDFFLHEAPLLTKILALTSPTGIVNSLSGKGIGFDGFVTDFTFREGTLELKGTRASGSAVGFTTEGSVQLGSAALKLEGTVIPAYMINSAIGRIPVVGDLLMGGKGEGLIATNFSVSGTYEDPNIRVNPLSLFTPGFLRGVFDIFDQDKKPADGSPPKEAPKDHNPRQNVKPKAEIKSEEPKAPATP